MLEYLTEAIVLDKEELGEADARVTFYTKELGRVTARATSARKITSKLNAHLEPLNLINLRLIHKNNFQIADALTLERFTNWRQSGNLPLALELLNFIKEMTYEGDGDYQLWTLLKTALYSSQIQFTPLLRALGFDPQFAVCQLCSEKPNHFSTEDHSFYCDKCRINAKCKDQNVKFWCSLTANRFYN